MPPHLNLPSPSSSPPGTGKTYIGIEFLRVLKANNVGPILMIAFTNHALDHMLSAVIDSGITERIVRLGSRSADERISQYNLETLETVQGQRNQDRNLPNQFRLLKQTQEVLKGLLTKITRQEIETKRLEQYLCDSYPGHYESLCEPPVWVELLRTTMHSPDQTWHIAGPRGSNSKSDDSKYFGFWKEAEDLAFLGARRSVLERSQQSSRPKFRENMFAILERQAEDEDDRTEDEELDTASLISLVNPGPAASWCRNWDLTDNLPVQEELPREEKQPGDPFRANMTDEDHLEDEIFGAGNVPEMPQTDRSLGELLRPAIGMWSLSTSERKKLSNYWRRTLAENMDEEDIEEFDRLRETYQRQRIDYSEIKDQVRINMLFTS